jgi:hypothetical protein
MVLRGFSQEDLESRCDVYGLEWGSFQIISLRMGGYRDCIQVIYLAVNIKFKDYSPYLGKVETE